MPAPVRRLLDCVAQDNDGDLLRRYPGACHIAARTLADPHRLLLCELHPRDHQALTRHFARARNVRVVCEDGYSLLKSELPPKETRAVTLIDPAYELRDEPTTLLDGLRAAFERFRHGTYVLWYPLTGKLDHARLLHEFVRLTPPKTLQLELNPQQDSQSGAVASGLLIVNPPFAAVEALAASLSYLRTVLAPRGISRFDWLVPE
ncbi:MAG: 23S rRNA (adenine(2030)-N(6))-methyltransferase RlmJ [Gammaproteobacteria bacterium]|nr:23S rRNA (adenine(2030)-N(6))-methyltransferase RlmJ [Gammaproteobacteria bacterium]